MSKFQTLTDAFTELEQRADAASRTLPAEADRALSHRSRVPLIAASVVAMLALAGGAVLLTRDHGSGSAPAAPLAAGGQPSTATTPAAPAGFQIPKTPAELATRFRAVLGDTATLVVTDTGAPVDITLPPAATAPASHVAADSPTDGLTPMTPVPNAAAHQGSTNGAAIVGTLTASGATGGFDLQIFRTTRGETAWCDSPGRGCSISTLADGSSLAVGHSGLEGAPNGVTYEVNLVRADGVEFLMHVSNERDPKGDSTVLSAHPPLSTDQMAAIVTSVRW
jgi:hypothetical protein